MEYNVNKKKHSVNSKAGPDWAYEFPDQTGTDT